MGRFFRSSLRTGRIYRSSNYGQFTQSMSPNYKNQWLADGGHRPRQSAQSYARLAPILPPPITATFNTVMKSSITQQAANAFT